MGRCCCGGRVDQISRLRRIWTQATDWGEREVGLQHTASRRRSSRRASTEIPRRASYNERYTPRQRTSAIASRSGRTAMGRRSTSCMSAQMYALPSETAWPAGWGERRIRQRAHDASGRCGERVCASKNAERAFGCARSRKGGGEGMGRSVGRVVGMAGRSDPPSAGRPTWADAMASWAEARWGVDRGRSPGHVSQPVEIQGRCQPARRKRQVASPRLCST